MYNHLLYFAYWIFDSIVIYLFGLAFPGSIVLGNWRFGPIEAAVYAGFWVTFFVWVLWDFAIAKSIKFDMGIITLGYFWSANIFAFWVVSRFSQYLGFGITRYFWAILIGLVAYLVQRFAWNIIVGDKKV